MISKLYIDKLRRMPPKRTEYAPIDQPVPLDSSMWLSDLTHYNLFICDIRVLRQMLYIIPNLPYMKDVKPVTRLYDETEYIAFDMWYPEVKCVTFAPCLELYNEYWAMQVSYESLKVNMDDIQGKPHHMVGVTADY